MDWQVKYKGEYTDILGLDWKIDILENAYAGAVLPLQFSGSPLRITYLANTDSLYDAPVRGSKADFTIESDTHFKYTDLYTTENRQFLVNIYHSSTTLYWQGYVLAGFYSEPYDSIPYSVTVSATCGLGLLKEIIYKDDSDEYYNGRLLASKIIIDILSKIGYTGFTEFVNIYEESMDDAVTDSPLDQVKIDVDVFIDMYCYEVLEEVLKPFNACIRIVAGQPTIYRPIELTGATVYGRIFTNVTTHTGTSITPEQFIKRTGIKSDIRDVNNGTLMVQAPAKKVTINHNYGYKESWISNWELKANTLHPSLSSVDFWSRGGGCIPYTVNLIDRKESDGMIPSTHNTYPTLDKYMYQSFGVYAQSTSDVICISFDYIIGNASGFDLPVQSFYIMVSSDTTGHWLKAQTSDDACSWETDEQYIHISDAVYMGSSGWINFTRQVAGLPATGSYTIKLFASDSTEMAVRIGYKNIKFFSTADEIIVKRINKYVWLNQWKLFRYYHKILVTYKDNDEIVNYKWIGTNAINGIELEYNMITGDVPHTGSTDNGANIDNILEQFAGAMSTGTFNYRVDTITLSGTNGTANITCNGVTKLATWTYDEEGTAEQFVIDWGGSGDDYFLSGVQVSYTGADLIFTARSKGVEFIGETAIETLTGDLYGSVEYTTALESSIDYSTDWNTRGGSESKELLSIIKDELTEQHSRPKQFLTSLPIVEDKRYSNIPAIDILGNFQDTLNKIGEDNRIFVFNSGSFNVRDREWSLDLIEII